MLADNETSFGTVDTAVDASSPLPSLPSQSTLMGALLIGCYFAVSLMDTLHSILITHTCYYYLISNYFDPPKLLDGVWSLRISITLTGFIITIAHVFFSRRIHLFSKSLWIPIAIMAISTVRLAFAIATTVVSFDEFTFIKFQGFTWLVCLTLGLDMISDIMITVSLCWFLQRSKTGFEKTDSVIDKLLLYAINTGLLTILFNIAVLICAGIMPDNLIFIGMFFIISKLYTNNLLAVCRIGRKRSSICALWLDYASVLSIFSDVSFGSCEDEEIDNRVMVSRHTASSLYYAHKVVRIDDIYHGHNYPSYTHILRRKDIRPKQGRDLGLWNNNYHLTCKACFLCRGYRAVRASDCRFGMRSHHAKQSHLPRTLFHNQQDVFKLPDGGFKCQAKQLCSVPNWVL
ncbi:hypothetical protein EW145_g2679 [Phellinidium pouzarii]|uniref:DUF6534 domain-containing protein n=1 Tax=Phellinidium pouzarii TaxID=167371 RepID=A0A4S4LA39_9AGAM|nr:hypothetical protein EW145_g2679 [Phellinidium pouzarii]